MPLIEFHHHLPRRKLHDPSLAKRLHVDILVQVILDNQFLSVLEVVKSVQLPIIHLYNTVLSHHMEPY